MILTYLLLLITWSLLNYIIYKINNNNFKQSRMQVSFLHAITVMISYLSNISGELLYYWSLVYYIIDGIPELVIILQKREISLFNFGIIFHHIITIKMLDYLTYLETVKYMYYAFFLAEISNIPMYIVYQLKSINYANKLVLKVLIFIEFITYLIARLIIGSYYLYIMWFDINVPWLMYISSWILLGISIIWTIKLIKQLSV